ncbi:RHS repeat-associated core domain-containing protein [Chitinophaga terrae (ex Kim and Jung 2007)]|uniref:RHS repeat-associated core domain-containing protein n=1 Tax=Chitinophaga terrae (ex Kim and Jung 2007) TaxID=408074 RepID=A0A1H4C7A0_9BACT|nr:RHS repeat-associated core domain-containing protein [Chitinophaga terrae (ex Kim and Jung 2007)]
MKGEGNQQDYGMRVYDPRVGKFLSVDPLVRNFAWNSSYAYAENSPIKYIDLDGAEKFDPSSKPKGITYIQLATVPISTTDANTDFSIKAGKYQLHPVSDPSGRSNGYWLARYTYTEGPYAGMYKNDWVIGTDGVGDFVKNTNSYYNKAGWIENLGGGNQSFNANSIFSGWEKINSNPINWLVGASIYVGVISSPTYAATVGNSTTNTYRSTFFAVHPETEGQVVVHHAIEQQVLKRYPGLFTESEINSLENLRGIPKSMNSDLHLSKIRKAWNEFYKNNPTTTRADLLKKATEIDKIYGRLFLPELNTADGTNVVMPIVPSAQNDK